MSIETKAPSPPTHSVVLTTGLGLSDRGVPLRLPALLVPGLSLLESLTESGRDARYVVYQATDFIIEANKLNAEKARQNAQVTENFLRAFVKGFFPALAPRVSILTGRACPVDSAALQEVEDALGALARTDSPPGQAERTDIHGAFDLIRSYGAHHKGGDVCLRYAAANVLLNGGFAGKYPFLDLERLPQATLMPLGGNKEAPFFALTTAMAKQTGCTHDVRPVIVPTGKMPAYYPCPDGDLLLGEERADFKPPRRTKSDFAALEAIGADIAALQALTRRVMPSVNSSPKGATL